MYYLRDFEKGIGLSEDIICKAIEEMSSLLNSREDFFNTMVCKRLNDCTEGYLSSFDSHLDMLYNRISSEKEIPLDSIRELIKKSSRLTSRIYNNFLKMLEKLVS